MNRASLIEAFKTNPRGGIVVVQGYHSASTGTVEDLWMNCGISWQRALERSAEVLDTFTVERIAAECPACKAQGSKLDALDLAAQALGGPNGVRQSVNKALAGTTLPSSYRAVAPGLYLLGADRVSDLTSPLYVRGLFQGRYVVEQGEHRVRRSKDLTLAKRWIERDLPRSKYKTIKLEYRSFQRVSVNRQRFTPADLFVNADRITA